MDDILKKKKKKSHKLIQLGTNKYVRTYRPDILFTRV